MELKDKKLRLRDEDLKIDRNLRPMRRRVVWLDMLHVVLCFVMIVIAALTFLNDKMFFWGFPAVFGMAAVLALLSGIVRLTQNTRGNSQLAPGLALIALAFLMAVLTVISIVSLL